MASAENNVGQVIRRAPSASVPGRIVDPAAPLLSVQPEPTQSSRCWWPSLRSRVKEGIEPVLTNDQKRRRVLFVLWLLLGASRRLATQVVP